MEPGILQSMPLNISMGDEEGEFVSGSDYYIAKNS